MRNPQNIIALDLLMVPSGKVLMLSFNSIPISNGIKLQISESLTHTLSIERLTLVMVSNSVDGLTHSAGPTVVSMMIKYLFNTMNLDLILQLIMDLVMRKLSTISKPDMMFLRDQLKPITEKMSQESSIENHGTSPVLDLTKLNLVAGLTHSDGLMKEMVMTEFSVDKSIKLHEPIIYKMTDLLISLKEI